jgi:hypothetical protein
MNLFPFSRNNPTFLKDLLFFLVALEFELLASHLQVGIPSFEPFHQPQEIYFWVKLLYEPITS